VILDAIEIAWQGRRSVLIARAPLLGIMLLWGCTDPLGMSVASRASAASWDVPPAPDARLPPPPRLVPSSSTATVVAPLEPEPVRAPDLDPVAAARALFAERCVVCHGLRGGGDGAVAAALSPRPTNFRDRAWQSRVSDAAIERAIMEGGGAVGRSALMPANPDLVHRPEVVQALRVQIRSLGR
jgi:mono/diheme cytochrome c family protein